MFVEYQTKAEECQHTADLFPEDRVGQEFAELAKRWRLTAQQNGFRFEDGSIQYDPEPRFTRGITFLIGLIGSIGIVSCIALVMWLAVGASL